MAVADVRECTIKVLTPLHVGCGDAYEPFSFTLDTNRKEILVFHMDELFRAMDQNLRSEFYEICREGTVQSLLRMYKFLKRLGERKDIVGKEGVVSRRIRAAGGFVEHYNEVVSTGIKNHKGGKFPEKNRSNKFNWRVITNFTIYRTAYTSSAEEPPVIPGSSVKGAIRTAVLNLRQGNAPRRRYGDRESWKLERDILLKEFFHQDPFSLVKVSDFHPAGLPEIKVVYAVNVKKSSGNRGRGPYQILEAVLQGEFRGTISVMKPEGKRGVKEALSFDEIEKALRAFYGKEMNREKNELKSSGLPQDKLDIKGLPIRIGRHSGAECVTIEGFRRIKIARNLWLDHATTVWVASEDRRRPSGALPFGWCELIW